MFSITNQAGIMTLNGSSEGEPAMCSARTLSTPARFLQVIFPPPLTPPNRSLSAGPLGSTGPRNYSPKSPFYCGASTSSIERLSSKAPSDNYEINEAMNSPVSPVTEMRPIGLLKPLSLGNSMNELRFLLDEKSSGFPKTLCSELHPLSPYHEENPQGVLETIYHEVQTVTPNAQNTSNNGVGEDKDAIEELFCAWLGTSVSEHADWLTTNSKTILDQLIIRRDAAETLIQYGPFDPENWLRLTQVYFELRFSDLQVASAHKAIFLIGQGLNLEDRIIGQKVREAVGTRLSCRSEAVIADDLEAARLEAFKAQLRGFFNLGAFWDGLKEAKYALKLFPGDKSLLLLQNMMKQRFERRVKELSMSSQPAEELKFLSRIGYTHKRQYPWLDDIFFARSQTFLNELNKEFNSNNCEIRTFSSRCERLALNLSASGSGQCFESGTLVTESNVGPLGVFAKRNIYKDEIILNDHSLAMVPIVPPKKLLHCDACHALLTLPFFKGNILRPKCCRKVAFCSKECQVAATTGYHRLLCGKDFRWVYSSPQSKELDPSWIPGALLRILVVVIADLKAKPGMHPLEHPLLARLTAGYASSPRSDKEHNWNYFSHVVAPTRILAQLGVDIISDQNWSAEVIHTIYWRIMNNACRTSSITLKDGSLVQSVISGIAPSYMMFNHSCDANVGWMAAGGLEGVARVGNNSSSSGKKRRGNEVPEVKEAKVGCNALLCIALRDIKKGEEARIAYLPPEHKDRLGKWFDGGRCLCGACEDEEDNESCYSIDWAFEWQR